MYRHAMGATADTEEGSPARRVQYANQEDGTGRADRGFVFLAMGGEAHATDHAVMKMTKDGLGSYLTDAKMMTLYLSLIHISEPTRLRRISYAVFCLKKKKRK